MRLGINTFLFTSPFTNDSTKLFKQFKQWGFDTIEIPIEDPSHIDPAHVKRELDKQGLVCGSVCACLGPDRDLRGTPKQQKTSLDYLKKVIDQMVVLDCPSVVGPVYSSVGRADAVPPAEYKKQWKTVVKNLKTLAAYAHKRGKQICLEPLNRFETDFINTCDQALKMVKAVGSPALKLHLDTFHMNIEEKDQAAAIRKAGKLLAHVHACGSDRGTPGNDHIDWKPIAKALKDVRYRGDVVIESFTTDVKVIARAAAIWRRIEPTRNEIAVKGLKFLRETLCSMNPKLLGVFTLGAVLLAQPALVAGAEQGQLTLLDDRPAEKGFLRIFNGKDLTGWEGNPKLWSVKDGAITGQTTADNPAKGNTFLIWTNGTPGDFELRCSFKLVPGDAQGFANSGIQYRSKVLDPANWVVGGYQADMEAGPTYTGILYEERMRGIMALRGEKVVWDKDGKKQVVGSVGNAATIEASVKKGDWNDYIIIAKGNHLQQFINGKPTIDLVDECEAKCAMSGVLALQLHAGPPMMVQFKNIRMKVQK